MSTSITNRCRACSLLFLMATAIVAAVMFVCEILPKTIVGDGGTGGVEGGGGGGVVVDETPSAASAAPQRPQPQPPPPSQVDGGVDNMRVAGNSTSNATATATAAEGGGGGEDAAKDSFRGVPDSDAGFYKVASAAGDTTGGEGGGDSDDVKCTPIFREVQFEADDDGDATSVEESSWQCLLTDTGSGGDGGGHRHAGGRIRTIRGLDPQWLDGHVDDMMGGLYDLLIPGAVVTEDEILVPPFRAAPAGDYGGAASNAGGAAPPPSLVRMPLTGFREKATSTTGERVVLAVRIVDPDGVAATATANELRESIFGTDDVNVNLRTQMEACSHGALTLKPYNGTTENGATVTGGVVEVNIDQNVTGESKEMIQHKATAALEDLVGDLPSQFDHVMLCIPPGTMGNWIAYAYRHARVNHLSFFNDHWCQSPTATMHEISHNLQIAHAGRNNSEYGDTSGTMGSSDADPNLPRKCFNGAKSYQLGWYANRTDSIDPLVHRWDGRLVGVVDYGDEGLLPDDLVVLKLESPNTARDYYVAFNHAVDFNSGNGDPSSLMGGNRVMVTTQGKGSYRQSKSNLEAILSVDFWGDDREYVIEDYGHTGVTVVVNVTEIVTEERPGYAVVSVYREDGESRERNRKHVQGNASHAIPYQDAAT